MHRTNDHLDNHYQLEKKTTDISPGVFFPASLHIGPSIVCLGVNITAFKPYVCCYICYIAGDSGVLCDCYYTVTSLMDINCLPCCARRCPFSFSGPQASHLTFLNGALRLFLSQTIIKSVAINILISHTNKNINA